MEKSKIKIKTALIDTDRITTKYIQDNLRRNQEIIKTNKKMKNILLIGSVILVLFITCTLALCYYTAPEINSNNMTNQQKQDEIKWEAKQQ
ncbi:hypothetical protein [Clostridium estertheticum]|uniref:hypothetical protein n=1 Tax=Clostridium estertheticum TaxID=238834 RepID=UPI001C7D36EE|nr:hypothetical protein [Clostridium estertheticum]MBX4268449.1 hypothetical protein [Clostridium estertheticum]WLC81491.1 hypothetical protein KTC98_09910 [Clostridium estertheticum]